MSFRQNRWLYLFGIVGLLLFIWFSWGDSSLPDPHYLKREQAVTQATDVLSKQGYNVSGWQAAATLESDSTVDGYLTRYDLQDLFHKKAPAQAPLVYWKVSFSQSSQDVTYVAQLDPVNGRLAAFQVYGTHMRGVVKESTALAKARAVLQQVGANPNRMTHSGGALQMSSSSTLGTVAGKKPILSSYRKFVYTDPRWKVGQMTLRYEVTVSSNQITGLQPVYVLPADFTKWHDGQQTMGTILTGLSALFSFLLFILAFVFLFLVKQRKRYGAALWLTLAIFVLFLISNLNQLPVMQQSILGTGASAVARMFGTTFMIVAVVVLTVIVAGGTFPMILTGGMLVQEVKEQLWTSWQSPDWGLRIRQGMWRGYLLAIIWLGFQQVFYWVAQTYFGVWSENDMSMSPANMWWPTLFPLMGWMAAIQEEMTYRMFGITFFKRYWKNTFLATLIPAMIWALGHSLYPVYPTYTRFIELTIFGVLIGYCYLRYGIETTIFAHAVFDVSQMCIPLLVSGIASQETAGALFLVSPIVVAYGLSMIQTSIRKKTETA